MKTTYQVTFKTSSGQLIQRTTSAPPNSAHMAVDKIERQQRNTPNAIHEIVKVIENYPNEYEVEDNVK